MPATSPEWLRLTAAIVAGLAGSMAFVLAPLFLAALRRAPLGLSENQIGLIGSADPTGLFIGAVVGLVLINRVPNRILTLLALAGVAVINIVCIAHLPPFPLLLVLRILSGTAGGLVLAVAYVGMGTTRIPERSYALYLIAQTIVGASLISLFAYLSPSPDLRTVFAALAALSLLAMTATPWLSGVARHTSNSGMPAIPTGRLTLLMIPAVSLIGAACLAIWVNFEGYGAALGLSNMETSAALSLGLSGAAAGSILVALAGRRFGQTAPCMVLMAMLVASAAALLLPLTASGFALVAFCFQFGISASNYIFGVIGEADASGNLSIVYLLSLKAGFAVGPWLGSRMIIIGGLDAIIIGGSIMLCFVAALFAAILRGLWRDAPSAR